MDHFVKGQGRAGKGSFWKPVVKAIGVEGPSDRQYRGRSCLGLLSPHDELRLQVVWLVETQVFQGLTLLVIVANCLMMAVHLISDD